MTRSRTERFFVAIDSEGMDYGEPYHPPEYCPLVDEVLAAADSQAAAMKRLSDTCFGAPRPDSTVRYHRTFLWGALKANGSSPTWLYKSIEKEELRGEEIVEWLLSVRKGYGPRAIFVSFAFGYDAAQVLTSLTIEKLKEVQDSDNYCIYNHVAYRYRKGKFLMLRRMRRGPVYRYSQSGHRTLNADPPLVIYDVFGFFQSSFLQVLEGMPGCVSPLDYEIIKEGKQLRLDFRAVPLAEVMRYTHAELRALNAIMARLREAILALGLRLTRWNGAGAVASAAFSKHGSCRCYPPKPLITARLEDFSPSQLGAAHAFFGGRIEMMRYGVHTGRIYSYDIVSAYPSVQASLPAMNDCRYEEIEIAIDDDPLRALDLLADWSILSFVEVRWAGGPYAFGPFPYRECDGSIVFPLSGRGTYCVEEVRAALRACIAGMPVGIYCVRGMRCILPPFGQSRPFSWIYDYYAARAEIKACPLMPVEGTSALAYDAREKIYKLALNAAYGKTAQRVGGHGSVPVTANPYYAAAITAATRARLLDAAMTDPYAIIMFATDGIYSTRPLPIPLDPRLGGWQETVHEKGTFVQPGVYATEQVVKNRGTRQSLDIQLVALARQGWETGEERIQYPYTQYITVGAASRTDRWGELLGCWIDYPRHLVLSPIGTKRVAKRSKRMYNPATRLVATSPAGVEDPAMPSAMYMPDWVDTELGALSSAIMENDEVMVNKIENV